MLGQHPSILAFQPCQQPPQIDTHPATRLHQRIQPGHPPSKIHHTVTLTAKQASDSHNTPNRRYSTNHRHHAGPSGGRVDSRLIGQLTDLISGGRLPCTHRRHYPNLYSRQRRVGTHELNVTLEASRVLMADNGRAPHHPTIRTLCWRGLLIETGIGMKRWDAGYAGAGWIAAAIRERRTCWTSRIAPLIAGRSPPSSFPFA